MRLFSSKNFYGVRNRATFSDSRSNFHTRVGYRTNVCRRRLASDSARASEGTPAQGALEDHHDRPPGSPPEKGGAVNSSRHRSPHLPTDSPDEAGKLSRDRGDDDCGLLAFGDHRAVAATQPGLCLPGDIANALGQTDEDLRLLLRDARWVLVAPCRFDEHAPGLTVPSLRDATTADRPTAGVFRRNKAKVAHQQAW